MFFNSFTYFSFLGLVLLAYAFLSHRNQNRLLLVASYAFYGWWDWRFLGLILLSTGIDYLCARSLVKTTDPHRRFRLLLLSLSTNLGLLGIFKYYNFFLASLRAVLDPIGLTIPLGSLEIILPVGISFYTFQTLSYTVDVYRGTQEPAASFLDFALFVCFFPQLVAGPIERAAHLLPQIESPRRVTWRGLCEGTFLITWGLYEKVFIADNLSLLVDGVYGSSLPRSGAQVVLATWAFAFQIYCDFDGYSNIAIGSARLLGIDLNFNFAFPYLSKGPSEFWRRWHISLSAWLRDYLYIPLGGSQATPNRTRINLVITMVLGGLWHGAAWNFVIWGAYQGLLLILFRGWTPQSQDSREIGLRLWSILQPILFFQMTCLGWLFFRATSVEQIFELLERVFFRFEISSGLGLGGMTRILVAYAGPFGIIQWIQARGGGVLSTLTWPVGPRVGLYLMMYFSITIFGLSYGQNFIYFQF